MSHTVRGGIATVVALVAFAGSVLGAAVSWKMQAWDVTHILVITAGVAFLAACIVAMRTPADD